MSEYKVKQIMAGEPREWKGPHGVVWYIEVMVEGHEKPLSVGKKDPNSLKVGDTIYGDIVETDYITDKFTPSAPPQGKPEYKPKDERQITRNMVWKNLLQHYDVPSMEPDTAQWQHFWGMVDLHTDMLLPNRPEAKPLTVEIVKETFKEPLPLPPEDEPEGPSRPWDRLHKGEPDE